MLILIATPLILLADDYTIQWIRTLKLGSDSNDGAGGVAVDSDCNVIVTGTCNLNYLTVKYDHQGTIMWIDSIDNGSIDIARDIAVDGSNNIIVTGSSVFHNNHLYFTVKYNPFGAVLWTDTIHCGGVSFAQGVAVDDANNVIVTGQGYIPYGTPCYFTVKYDSMGNILWADTLDPGEVDQAFGVAVDNQNNIAVTGMYCDWLHYDTHYYTVKYDPSGSICWIDTVEDAGRAYDVAVDNSNNIIITGNCHNYYNYTVKYNSSGNILWDDTLANGASASSIAVDQNNNIIITGTTMFGNDRNYYTIKCDPNGIVLWTHSFGDTNTTDLASGIAVDSCFNIIVTGTTSTFPVTISNFLTVKYQYVSGSNEIQKNPYANFLKSIELHPNPAASGRICISYYVSCPCIANLDIYDIMGNLCRSLKKIIHSPGYHTTEWNGHDNYGKHISNGVYFVHLEVSGSKATAKLVINR